MGEPYYQQNGSSQDGAGDVTRSDYGFLTTSYPTPDVNLGEWLQADVLPELDEQTTLGDASETSTPPPREHDELLQESVWAPDFAKESTNVYTPLEASNAFTLLYSPEPKRELSISKRRAPTGLSVVARAETKGGKRLKKVQSGYACKDPECERTFDRKCDADKHYRRTHDTTARVHACSHCAKQNIQALFNYPKDVRRHERQVHRITAPEAIEQVLLTPGPTQTKPNRNVKFGQLERLDTQAAVAARTSRRPVNHAYVSFDSNNNLDSSSVTSPATPKSAGWRALARSIMQFKKLSLHAQGGEKLIMVTLDQKNFHEVDVTGIKLADGFFRKVLAAFQLSDFLEPEHVAAQTYRRRREKIYLGEVLSSSLLMELVGRDADAQGSFKLLISLSWPGQMDYVGSIY